jgi:imidazolonepropionase-like amidohydrolase
MKLVFVFLFLLLTSQLFAQLPVPVNGVAQTPDDSFVLTNVKILVSPEKTIENGTIVVRNGKIEAIGGKISEPKDLPIIDGQNHVVVPSFIELNSSLGVPEYKEQGISREEENSAQISSPYYWNHSIHPELNPLDSYSFNENALNDLHKMGFGLAVIHTNDGIAQGYGSLISLGKINLKNQLIKSEVAGFYSFNRGNNSQSYPSSQMGSIALLRQSLYDAEWQEKYGREPNLSLDALNKQKTLPCFFGTSDQYELLRVTAIDREFKRSFILMGSGHEYELGKVFDTLKHSLVIPINFPEAYDLKDPYIARQISLGDLKHWELAPGNLKFLTDQKADFAITSSGLKTSDAFWSNLHKAFAQGYTPKDALNALTIMPAKTLGLDKEYGTLDAGKWAYFTVFEQDPFLYKTQVLEVVTKGNREVKSTTAEADIRGTYSLTVDGIKYGLDIKGTTAKLDAKITLPRTSRDSITGKPVVDTLSSDAYLSYSENDVVLQFILNDKVPMHYSLKGIMNTRLFVVEGDGTGPSGAWVKWVGFRTNKFTDKEQTTAWSIDTLKKGTVSYPNMAFGFDSVPTKQYIVFENATVWTNEEDGIIENATVIVENGKIKTIHKSSSNYTLPKGAKVIDAKGKHLTCGIIDEHSHISLSKGVNEGGQAISCEVRIGDVITGDDINVYRQLSGGVTAAQLLHGSANPIGGQSALVKLKWGHLPQDYLIQNAPKFVKFALGENVKQSNWGDWNTIRFPQTRMGVEQVYIDGFSRALAYHEAMTSYHSMSEKQREKTGALPPARDLELDALYEIVKGERRITCHSYIQSEINMLMHVADSFNFNVNTFTHILEGYKVADKMKEHGAGASTFADWWAYKYEVKDAIPYNASLMNQVGLTVAINSDDAEMGRRLNQEAAKVIKYGGISEIDAWKLVTLNPAKLLHLDDRMGSVKVGKDADLVLWTTNPLSIEAKVLYTIVDGEILYDSEESAKAQISMNQEKTRLITKMHDAGKSGAPTKTFTKKRRGEYHCDTIGEETSTEENTH